MRAPGRGSAPPAESVLNQSSLPRSRTTCAHDHEGRGLDAGAFHAVGERIEGALDDPLALGRSLLDEGGRGRGVETVLDEPRADLAKAHQPHVDDDRLARPRHRRPVEGRAPVLEVSGDERARVGVVAVGEGDPGIRRAPRRRGHPGNDLERDPFVGEGRDLLPAPPEDERVPALQAQHPPPLAGEADEEAVDVGLPHRVLVAPLPRVDPLRVPADEREHPGRHEAVVHHHVGLLHQAHRAERQEVRVAGAGPDEIDLPGRVGASRPHPPLRARPRAPPAPPRSGPRRPSRRSAPRTPGPRTLAGRRSGGSGR